MNYIFKWLNSSERWHDIGHALFQFFLYTTLPWYGLVNILVCLSVFIMIELYQAKFKVGKMLRNPDFWFDYMTHAVGIIVAFYVIYVKFGA